MRLPFRLRDAHSKASFYTGYVVQAAVNTLAPLLYAMFNRSLSISLQMLGLVATVNFVIQIATDLLAAVFLRRIGYRRAAVIAHLFSGIGLIGLSLFPLLLPNALAGILLATAFMAVGGGMIEVIISPMLEAMPGDNKAGSMSLLHSFYCWGQCAVVLGSTLFFVLFGMESWHFLPPIWASVPLLNAVFLLFVPIYTLDADEEAGKHVSLFRNSVFWLLFLMMIAAGSSELAMSMWASLFAELGLGVDKSLGDLLGPCLFALLMGIGRILSGGVLSEKMRMEKILFFSAAACVICYGIAVFSQNPILSLLGCAFTGLFVAVMWPGTYSLAAQKIPGGTRMFAFLAFAGDIGCTVGSFLVGQISDLVDAGALPFFTGFLPKDGTGLRAGLLIGLLFPLLMVVVSGIMWRRTHRSKKAMHSQNM